MEDFEVVSKSNLALDDDNIAISFAFTKVDKANRMVTGIATADNADLEDDIIDSSASEEAFKAWVGNIREMHGPKAVGRAVSSKPVMVKDGSGNVHKGIEVTSYISKGSNDTWEKILDGTLTGYSIGGRVLEKVKEFHKSTNKTYSRIKKYILTELSVVDSPANPLAQFTMFKNLGGVVEFSDNINSEPVYYCDVDEIAKAGESICSVCDTEMQEIGFIASLDSFSTESVSKMIDSHLQKGVSVEKEVDNLHNNDNDDIIKDMDLTADQKVSLIGKFVTWLNGNSANGVYTNLTSANTNFTISEFVVGTETPQTDVPTAEAVAKAVETKEDNIMADNTESVEIVAEAAPALDIEALLKSVTETVTKAVEAVLPGSPTDVAAEGWSNRQMEEFGGQIKDLHNRVEEFAKSIGGVAETLTKFEERLSALENSGAVRKSVDEVDSDDEVVIQKSDKSESLWGNALLPKEIINSLGYEN